MDNCTFNQFFSQLSELYLKEEWSWGDYGKTQIIKRNLLVAKDNGDLSNSEMEILYNMGCYLCDRIQNRLINDETESGDK